MSPAIPPLLHATTAQAAVVDDESLPWLPLTSCGPVVRIKHFRLDPHRGEMVSLIRAASGARLPRLRHANSAVVYTLEGHWKFAEHDWIAGPGSMVFVPAQTMHHPEVIHDGKDTLTFHITTGDVTVIGPDLAPLTVLNWKSALERYLAYCEHHCIEPKDLTVT